MSEAPTLVYLEADDEVTSVARRVRQAQGDRVVLVAPGRSRATSSVVALRLLSRVGDEAGVTIAVAGDALTRSLAAEAGLDTYASVEDARNAIPAATQVPPRRAAIHVVRGPATDETAAAVPVVASASPEPTDEVTRPHPVARTIPTARRSTARAAPVAGILAVLAALLVAGGVLGVAVLPAATIEITPRSEPVGPLDYDIEVADAERLSGTAADTAVVTATGAYPIQVAASGSVTLFNWTSGAVNVPAGTLVATGNQPGDQAFPTQADVVVPRGTLTPQGTIAAGTVSVPVAAAAIGPAANVAAGEIDTVLTPSIDQRLRGFPENPERRVENPEPTAGGVDTTGPEITQADVDAAVASLREALAAQVTEALVSSQDLVTADAQAAPEPTIEGLDGLVGTRDQVGVEISGTLAYDRLSVQRDTVIERAEERLVDDEAALPSGHALLPGATRVIVGTARVEGDRLVVPVSVSGLSAPELDRADVLARVRGRPAAEAEAALSELGTASVELWPGWVASVPELDWRIDLRLREAPTP